MKLLIYCNKFDENDDLLGFFPKWVYALLNHFEKIIIITPYLGQHQTHEKLSVVRLKKHPRFIRLFQFYYLLWSQRRNYENIFVLMAPAWLIAAAPAKFFFRKKLILWYAVWKKTNKLRLATFLADRIVASVPESFPIRTSKLVTVGQGIDTEYFKPAKMRENKYQDLDPLNLIKVRILYLGRISPIKKIKEIIGQISGIPEAELHIVGGPVNKIDIAYLEECKDEVKKLNISERVHFWGRRPHNEILPFYQNSDIFVNLTPTGSFDKTMLEAMASGCIILVENKALESYLDQFEKFSYEFVLRNEPDLAEKIKGILRMKEETKNSIRGELRNIVIGGHSLDVMIPKLAKALYV